jgi:Mn2+/Fe2+ NRAMP family transporter
VVTPLPATFETSALSISPSEINTGDTATIQATVTNSGDVSGTYTAVLKIDGNIESTQDLALTAGEAQNVVFSVSENTAGTYSVDVDGQTGTLTVKAASSSKSFLARDWWLLLVLIIIVALITYIVVSTTRKKDSSKNK